LIIQDGTLVLNELHFDSGKQRQLNELLFKGSSESPVPKIVGLAEFLTSAIPIISSSSMMWTVFPGPWRVDGKGITYIRCINYIFL